MVLSSVLRILGLYPSLTGKSAKIIKGLRKVKGHKLPFHNLSPSVFLLIDFILNCPLSPITSRVSLISLLIKTVLKRASYSAIKRNETGSFVEAWMDLETVIQSEVSQKEKNKYSMLTHIYGI